MPADLRRPLPDFISAQHRLDCPKSSPGQVQGYFCGPGPGPPCRVRRCTGPGPGPQRTGARGAGPGPGPSLMARCLHTRSVDHLHFESLTCMVSISD